MIGCNLPVFMARLSLSPFDFTTKDTNARRKSRQSVIWFPCALCGLSFANSAVKSF